MQVCIQITDIHDRLTVGVAFDGDDEAIRQTVDRFIQGEGQGSFVLETSVGWRVFPTRSILHMDIVRRGAQENGDTNE